jgi:proteasome activator subunit 4
MSELQDSKELQTYSSAILYLLSAIVPPSELLEPVLAILTESVRHSSSWRIRLNTLPVLQVFYFRNLPAISDDWVQKIMDVVNECLKDENVEVREMAATTLSGIIRCSQRRSILSLKDRFTKLVRKSRLPPKGDPTYPIALRNLHSGVLGVTSLIDAYPYAVEPWMPPLMEVLAAHASDPPPVSTSIRKSAARFKKTHQDTWHIDQHAFDEDQLQALSTILSGTSYYA